MNMHMKISLTPLASKDIWLHYGAGSWAIVALSRSFMALWTTICKVGVYATEVHQQSLLGRKIWHKTPSKSKSLNWTQEKSRSKTLQQKLPRRDEHKDRPRAYLFIAIDDFPRELWSASCLIKPKQRQQRFWESF